jgi:Fic family protein
MYIHQRPAWPGFFWDAHYVSPLLARVRNQQGRLLGRIADWGFELKEEASLESIVSDVLTSSEIEGEMLPADQVRSSVARKLGLEYAGLVPVSRDVDGVVDMLLDATQNYEQALTHERLYGWQAALFPTGRSGLSKVQTGQYRKHGPESPMQVISGGFGRERVHFQAPASERVLGEMSAFLKYINEEAPEQDPVIRAAIAHLWFLTVHPFDDGNGRVARAVADMMLARADESKYRFYSMSSAILEARKSYYTILERTQKDDLEITEWLRWFLTTMLSALDQSEQLIEQTFQKARFWQCHAATSFNDRQKEMLNRLLDGFTGNLTSSKWAKITKVSQDTANRDINDLIGKQVLKTAESGGRSTHYLLEEI